jgi:hypothetical protein
MPVAGGPETRVLDSVDCTGLWAVSDRGIYYISTPDADDHREIRLSDFAAGQDHVIVEIDRDPSMRIAVSPDESTLLFTQVDNAGMDLMLVENFR